MKPTTPATPLDENQERSAVTNLPLSAAAGSDKTPTTSRGAHQGQFREISPLISTQIIATHRIDRRLQASTGATDVTTPQNTVEGDEDPPRSRTEAKPTPAIRGGRENTTSGTGTIAASMLGKNSVDNMKRRLVDAAMGGSDLWHQLVLCTNVQ